MSATTNPRGAGRKPPLSADALHKAAALHRSGLTHTEIGERFGVSKDAVQRALSKLRQEDTACRRS